VWASGRVDQRGTITSTSQVPFIVGVLVPLLLVVLALGVVAVTAALATSRIGRMPDAPFDREPADMPTDRWILGRDLDRTRFALGVRGYRMDQVDDILDRLARDLVQRDEYSTELESVIRDAGLEPPMRPMPQTAADQSQADTDSADESAHGTASDDRQAEAADSDGSVIDEHEDDTARG
jgi:DivIVA domain-containing protein